MIPSELAASYAHCRNLHREHGRTYYLATRLLPAWKRRHVHALYGFTRYTDDIPDRVSSAGPDDRAERLDAWIDRYHRAVAGESATGPVLPAFLATVAVFDLDRSDIESFLTSMRMDLHVDRYAEYDDLLGYMEGSAAVIGTLMLPILLADETAPGIAAQTRRAAREPARQLGLAFQLTNFIRDVAEDHALGRVYLPQADLTLFGVSDADLGAATASPQVRRLIAYEIDRAREHYRNAAVGLDLLPWRSRRCIHLALVVYSAILDQIEASGYDVLAGRVTVPARQRVAATVRELSRTAG